MPEVGDVLAGKYELVKLIGEGGMGSVYEAKHKLIGKRMAVKLLKPELTENTELVGRFAREAEAAAAIGHPAIIDINDIGTTDDGTLFLVMEYLEGKSLGDVLDREKTVEPSFAAYVVCQVLSALDAAHSKGIVHRDLKPDNIFLVDKGQALPEVKLLDFGISKVVDHNDPDARLTQTGAVMGTPFYMAPEQAMGKKDLDHKVDIYAMGVILYECVTGHRPFTGDNTFALIHEVVNSYPQPPSLFRPDLPQPYEGAIQYAMAKDRNDRFQLAAHMLEQLLPFVEETAKAQLTLGKLSGSSAMTDAYRGVDSVPSLDSSQPVSTPGMNSATDMAWSAGSMSQMTEAKPRRIGLIAGIVTAVVVVLVGGLVAAFVLSGDDDAPAPPPPPVPPVAAAAAAPVAEPSGGQQGEADSPQTQPEPEMIEVTLQEVPEGAQILVNGEPVNDPVIRRPQGAESQEISISLAGHRTWTRQVSFEQNTAIIIALQAEPATPEATPSTPTKRAGRTERSGRSGRSSASSRSGGRSGSGGRSSRSRRFASDFD